MESPFPPPVAPPPERPAAIIVRPRRNYRTPLIVVGAVVAAVVFAWFQSTDRWERIANGCRVVEYRATSSEPDQPMHVYIRNATGESEERDVMDGRYSRTFDCFESSLTSLQVSIDEGTVKCEIRVDGEIVAKATSSGEFPDARCLD